MAAEYPRNIRAVDAGQEDEDMSKFPTPSFHLETSGHLIPFSHQDALGALSESSSNSGTQAQSAPAQPVNISSQTLSTSALGQTAVQTQPAASNASVTTGIGPVNNNTTTAVALTPTFLTLQPTAPVSRTKTPTPKLKTEFKPS
ncbi:hypothetical protein BDN72DRAFT_864349 [Pluteus cervinus]|uniref:Uncharacterized protein n=1 Tax=Pluteus cervinus TaxID=181527 RepID=A0ACD3A4I8_9AGAR|nr:hypothetical protein BDN72DRAFT_864349 [Pluteus cervinus]